jgi:lysophospholipase L1-like esterase
VTNTLGGLGRQPELAAWHGKRYVALGSSFASGPGIAPRVPGTPWQAGRSQRNYAHLVAAAAGLQLTDVTSSGATCEHLLTSRQFGQPPQIRSVGSGTDLVTVTIGGNDIGLTPYLLARRLPRLLGLLPPIAKFGDASAAYRRLETVEDELVTVLEAIAAHAPYAHILVVNYLSVLGPESPEDTAADRHYRRFAESLAAHTEAAAKRKGAELIDARTPSLAHPPGHPDGWTIDFYFPLPGKTYPGSPCHPTAAGMAAIAELVTDRLRTLNPRR